jgi:DNA-binding IclR family transcriptional regulator
MEALADELDTECHAGMRIGDAIFVVARVGPLQPLGLGVRVGERFPLTPPIGASYVAWSRRDDIEAYLGTAEGDLTAEEIEHHRQVIEAIRRRGYSVHVEAGPRQRLSETAERIASRTSSVCSP